MLKIRKLLCSRFSSIWSKYWKKQWRSGAMVFMTTAGFLFHWQNFIIWLLFSKSHFHFYSSPPFFANPSTRSVFFPLFLAIKIFARNFGKMSRGGKQSWPVGWSGVIEKSEEVEIVVLSFGPSNQPTQARAPSRQVGKQETFAKRGLLFLSLQLWLLQQYVKLASQSNCRFTFYCFSLTKFALRFSFSIRI